LAIVMLSACCGGASDPHATVPGDPCVSEGCNAPGAQLNVSYPYRLWTHCGVLEIRFDGRVFYLESLNPADVLVGLDQPQDTGTMVLLSAHLAEFRDAAGHSIRFVDTWPGLIGQAYPFTARISTSNQLIDARFAGRVWHASGTLQGVSGPPYGNGQDRFTAVNGRLTLVSTDRATFATPNGTTVEFVRIDPVVVCD
jgi:hypothetical protein